MMCYPSTIRKVDEIFLVFSKEFVTVLHGVLPDILFNCRLSRLMLHRVMNWLNGRSQKVVVNEASSVQWPVTRGVSAIPLHTVPEWEWLIFLALLFSLSQFLVLYLDMIVIKKQQFLMWYRKHYALWYPGNSKLIVQALLQVSTSEQHVQILYSTYVLPR